MREYHAGWRRRAGGGAAVAAVRARQRSRPVMDCDAAAAAANMSANVSATAELGAALVFRNESRYWMQRVLQPAVVLVGVVGNLLTVVVLTRPRMSSSTNTYLTALAVTDLAYLACVYSLSYENHPGITGVEYIWYWRHWKYAIWIVDCTSKSAVAVLKLF